MAEQATHGFTRRSFIKGAAVLTATGALVGCSPQTPQQIFWGFARIDSTRGYHNVSLFGGILLRATYNKNAPA